MELPPFLSIIVPAFNEHHTLIPLLNAIYAQNLGIPFEVLIVDDGSIPSLRPLIQPLHSKFDNLFYFRLKKNSGKGSAVRIGLKHARGQYVLIQDADLEYHPADIPLLLRPILSQDCKVVYGSRFSHYSRRMTRVHNYGNKTLTWLTNLLFHVHLTDMETGYKLFPCQILQNMRLNGSEFEMELEITMKLAFAGYRIHEIPISYTYRTKGNAKITIFDGFETIYLLFFWRYFPNSAIWQYLYHLLKHFIKPILIKILHTLVPVSPRIK
jgi:glycosyltransferase involved in cell wall biosynthesis